METLPFNLERHDDSNIQGGTAEDALIAEFDVSEWARI